MGDIKVGDRVWLWHSMLEKAVEMEVARIISNRVRLLYLPPYPYASTVADYAHCFRTKRECLESTDDDLVAKIKVLACERKVVKERLKELEQGE